MNYLILSVDTLRHDVISEYITPNMYNLLHNSINFSNSFSQAPCTVPSFASAFTGLYPHEHGLNQKENKGLSEEIEYLPSQMKEKGYKTICLQGNSQLDKVFKFNRGYDVYLCKELCRRVNNNLAFPTAKTLSIHAQGLLKDLNKSPFLMWVNFIDAHCPYDSPIEFEKLNVDMLKETSQFQKELNNRSEFFNLKHNTEVKLNEKERKYVFSRYMAGVRRVDQAIGEILHSLKEEGLEDDTMIIFFSDHGEEFWEHGDQRDSDNPYQRGVDHGHTLYNELIKVPFSIRIPSEHKEEVEEIAELKNIYNVVNKKITTPDKIINAVKTEDTFSEHLLYGTEKKAYINNKFEKVIYKPEENEFEFYNIKNDSKEINPIKKIDEDLKNQVIKFAEGKNNGFEGENIEITEEVKDRLEGLGYL